MNALLLLVLGMVLVCSLINFIFCAVDKRAAKAGRRRIPERRFFTIALLGGGPGLWMGMRCFHHKTLHRSFWLAAIGTTLLYCALLVFLTLKICKLL